MKKSAVVLMLLVEFFLLFIFLNIHSLFLTFSKMDVAAVDFSQKILKNAARSKDLFLSLSILMGILLLFTGFYLLILFRRRKEGDELGKISPLQNYLVELRSKEQELKGLLEKQRENVVEKEELSKTIINNINAAIIFENNANKIDIFNRPAELMFEQSFANAKNNSIAKILANHPGIVDVINRAQTDKISVEIVSLERIFDLDVIPIEKIGKLIMIRDITEEKKREEISRLQQNFIMLGEMTTFLTHEIRNSLGVIMGYTKTIKSEKEKVTKVNKEINFLTTLIESFLHFSRPLAAKVQKKVNILVLVKKLAGQVNLKADINLENIFLESDETLLHSVFSNLLINAKEAGADQIWIEFVEDSPLTFLLKDNGHGLDDINKEKIWLPFFTTKDKGTGMGLAIVKKIINSLNGDISLVSSDKKGTTFSLVFYQ